MIETQSIELSQRTAIDHIREVCGHPSESHSFASLFLWQRDMGLTIGLAEDAYIVRCASRSPNCWYFPCGDRRQVTDWIQELLARPEPLELIYLLEEDARFLEARFPGEFRIEPSDGDSEYLYDRSTYLAILRGNDGMAAAFATILTVVTAVSLLLYLRMSKSEDLNL